MFSGPADNREESREGPRMASPPTSGPGLLVVAIDDDPLVLGFYQATLGGMGVRVETSTDPARALDLVASHTPALVILDLTMPEVGGMEVLRRIKERDPQTRVAIATGNYSIETAVEAIQQGALDYICKPVSLAKLRDLVTTVRSLAEQEER